MILIKGIASLGAAMLIGLSAPSAQAGYVVDLTQQGSNVVASGSGAIDLTGLIFLRVYFPIQRTRPQRSGLYLPGRRERAQSTLTATLLGQRISGADPRLLSIRVAETSSASSPRLKPARPYSCHMGTSPTVSCRTPRPTITRHSAASARRPAHTNGRGGPSRTRTSRSSSAPRSRNPRPGR